MSGTIILEREVWTGNQQIGPPEHGIASPWVNRGTPSKLRRKAYGVFEKQGAIYLEQGDSECYQARLHIEIPYWPPEKLYRNEERYSVPKGRFGTIQLVTGRNGVWKEFPVEYARQSFDLWLDEKQPIIWQSIASNALINDFTKRAIANATDWLSLGFIETDAAGILAAMQLWEVALGNNQQEFAALFAETQPYYFDVPFKKILWKGEGQIEMWVDYFTLCGYDLIYDRPLGDANPDDIPQGAPDEPPPTDADYPPQGTDPNAPGYDPRLDPNSPYYDPSLSPEDIENERRGGRNPGTNPWNKKNPAPPPTGDPLYEVWDWPLDLPDLPFAVWTVNYVYDGQNLSYTYVSDSDDTLSIDTSGPTSVCSAPTIYKVVSAKVTVESNINCNGPVSGVTLTGPEYVSTKPPGPRQDFSTVA